jgi:RecA-family ATPase
MHHKCKLENLVVVQHPVDLLRDSDVGALIQAIKLVEERVGQKAQLIVGDTMARMTVGANENSVEDMGLAVANCDAIRRATGAHFCLIHHSGKDLDRGPRGHTSLRAAVDTEIQVALVEGEEGEVQGRRARVTKQRDLPVGESIYFDLRVLEIGRSQWGSAVTSCVVVWAAQPKKTYQAPANEIKDQGQKPKGKGRLQQVKKISLDDGWRPINQNGFNPNDLAPAKKTMSSASDSQGWVPIEK